MDAKVTEKQGLAGGEQISGRWIRDQLREVADPGLEQLEVSKLPPRPEPSPHKAQKDAPKAAPGADPAEVSDLVDNLAASISSAVVQPIRNLEKQRVAEKLVLQKSLEEHNARLVDTGEQLGRLSGDIRRLDQVLRNSQTEVESSRRGHDDLKSRVEAIEGAGSADAVASLRTQISELTNRLSSIEATGREREKRLEALTSSESRRQEALGHFADLLERMRETVTMMGPNPEKSPDTHS